MAIWSPKTWFHLIEDDFSLFQAVKVACKEENFNDLVSKLFFDEKKAVQNTLLQMGHNHSDPKSNT
jgi:hypothetical protein